jgi:hypothetical protein
LDITFTKFLVSIGYNTLISLPGLVMLYFVIRRSTRDGVADAAKIIGKDKEKD